MFKVLIIDLMVAIGAVQQGVKVGDEMLSGLMFAVDFVGVSGTAAGLQEQQQDYRNKSRRR